MRRTFTVMLALCLIMPLGFLVGCQGDITTGPGTCFNDIGDVGGDVSVTCGDDPAPADVNLCSPSGTDVGDETCLQNGGFRECVPCTEVM